ncbi:hypothetical protein [Aeromicrobium sp.]|uniref:hypothetical protein n=1 Tax=Aeromicrobium sp. TaxID=1871063 RepID=UPI0019AE0A35|nr:hypothetical protein [Aeromicrobium sp.]MBC7632336.1 hypothetical protein [Aeromicrobium sp.]
MLKLAAMLIALSVAIWAGTLVRHHLEGPGPVDTVKTATAAFADGNCTALRKVSARPSSIKCSEVTEVQRSYRDRGLKPSSFTYELASRDGNVAMVQINYRQDGKKQQELIPVEKRGNDWLVSAVSGGRE